MATQPQRGDGDAPSILLVFDAPADRTALSAALRPLGARLVEASSGADALELVASESFAVALLDVQMPTMDGFELATRLRALERGRQLPIVFVSALHPDEAGARRGYEVGGADYVTKPFDVAVLRARVRAFVDLFAQREAVRQAQGALCTRERDDAVRRLVALERVATAALETSDLRSLLEELLRIFMAATEAADSAVILLRDGGRLELEAAVGAGGEVVEGHSSLAIGEGFAGKIAAERRPFELADAARSTLVRSAWLRARGTQALYGVPLLHDGEVLGVAHVGSVTRTSFSERDKNLLASLAERAAGAVAMQLERDRLFGVLANMPALFAVLRVPSLELEHLNDAARALFGGRDLTDERAAELDVGEPALEAVRRACATGQAVCLDELVASFPVGRRVLRFTAQPLCNHAGTVDRVLVFGVDVTAQVSAREELEAQRAERGMLLERERAARAEAELASRAKDEFLATVSHELRTPLNAILGWAVVSRPKASPEVERALAIIERNARAQARMIEDVLDISRIVSGRLRLESTRVDVAGVVQAAAESLRPAAEAKDVALSVDVAPLPPVSGDAERLQQVVTNLVSNGIKFTPAGGHVDVRVSAEGAGVCIRVADSGEGIEADFLPHVFEPFKQGDSSSARRHGGLGLGLAIARQLVHAHGGHIEVTSRGKGEGAAFTVRLPASASGAFSTTSAAGRSRERARLDGLRVLVVDDDEDARALLRVVMVERGAEVAVASSAHEGFATFERFRPDVVVSDIAMPGGDGYGLVRAIRGLSPERGGRTPAVAVTAHAREQDGERAFAAGFQRHLAKPVDIGRLVAVVANLGGLSFVCAGEPPASSARALGGAAADASEAGAAPGASRPGGRGARDA